MKYLKTFENFNGDSSKYDDILDRAIELGQGDYKKGLEMLPKEDKNFLNGIENKNKIYEDQYFAFELTEIRNLGDEEHYIGILSTPDIHLPGGETIEGEIKGYILVEQGNLISPVFSKKVNVCGVESEFTIFDFCEGLEYEMDSFIENTAFEIHEDNKKDL